MGEEGSGEDEEGGEDKNKKDPLRLRSADTSPTSVGEEEEEEEKEKITGGTPVPRGLVESAIAYCLLPIAYCLLPIAYCLLPIAYCPLPIAHC